VERNPPKPTGFIQEFKSAALTGWKYNLLKWDAVNPAFPSIPKAELKAASAKFLVVANAAQQFLDRRHPLPKVGGQCCEESPALCALNFVQRAFVAAEILALTAVLILRFLRDPVYESEA